MVVVPELVWYAIPWFLVYISMESRSLTFWGAVTALLMSYVILLTEGINWYIVFLTLPILGTLATRFKEDKKEKLKVLQKVRGPYNAMANGGIALIMAVLGTNIGLFGFVGSIAAATADTMSSEIGVLSKGNPIMITTLRRVKKGQNGAVSAWGTFAAVIVSLVVGVIGILIWPNIKIVWVALIAGVSGMLIDSLIGALFENRGWTGNNTTNMFCAASGAIIGMLVGVFL